MCVVEKDYNAHSVIENLVQIYLDIFVFLTSYMESYLCLDLYKLLDKGYF